MPLWAGRWAWWWRTRTTTRTGLPRSSRCTWSIPSSGSSWCTPPTARAGRDGSGASRETLGAVRRVEDANAWRVVGRSPYRQEWFGYPDGGVPDVPFDELVDRVATVLGEERPDVVATFGPDGITGHPDHIRIC